MSNLTNNTLVIQNLIDKINNLPNAGSGGIDTSDATVTADEIFSGEIAYGANGKLTGTFTIDNELTEQTDLISQISQLVQTKANPPSSGIDTSDATATSGDILSGKTAYVKGEKITGTIATKTSSNLTASEATVTVPAGYYASNASKSVSIATQATPTVTIDANGKISASATQTAGYVSAGTKTGTMQLNTKAATTITPTTSSQTAVAKNVYTTGAITVVGDSNLIAGNIKNGVSIFGVSGDYEGSGVNLPTLSNEATSADLLANKELINSSGLKVTGTMPNNGAISSTMDGINTKSIAIPKGYTSGGTVSLDNTIDNEVAEQTDLISQITTALEGKAAATGGEDVTAETSAYTAKLATLETAITALETELQGKASGGGSSSDVVETCTLRVSNSDGKFYVYGIEYEALENSRRVIKYLPTSGESVNETVTDAVCGGILLISGQGETDSWYILDNIEEWSTVYSWIFKITAPANGTATIDLMGE